MRRFIFAALLLFPLTVHAEDAPSEISAKLAQVFAKVEKGRKAPLQIGMYVAELEGGEVVYSRNGEELMAPASVAKLLTTYTALKLLGGSYKFPTEVYVDRTPLEPLTGGEREAGEVGNLYVRGYGDPSLVNERMLLLAQELHARGVTQVNDLLLDDTLFIQPPAASGTQPYQAGANALSVNFNSYAVTLAPSRKGQRAQVELAPGADVALVNKVLAVSGKRYQTQISQNKNTLTVSGNFGEQSPLTTEYRSVAEPADYFGSVLKYSLSAAGIKVVGRIKRQAVPQKARLLTTFYSKDLSEIIRDMNLFSNNFIAEQLLYAVGQDQNGFFNRTVGLERVGKALAALGIKPENYILKDGSGLSHEDRVSPLLLIKIIRAAHLDLSIGPDFFASLSRFGDRGTLKSRKLPSEKTGGKKPIIWGKTGSLDGVSSVTGVYQDVRGRKRVFAVILNGSFSFDEGKQIEDQLLDVLFNSDEVVLG